MRVLQVGYGTIGKEVWTDYRKQLKEHAYMVTDLREEAPEGYEWDGERVDLAVILVDTPAGGPDGFDYAALTAAIEEYLPLADFILVRSTVSLGFLRTPVYQENRRRIGFSPEFYGATEWSRRGVVDLNLSIFTVNVPPWFWRPTSPGRFFLGEAEEVIIAKLAENAYLATKVTFFHELAVACADLGVDFENVRAMTTADPRIGEAHSHMRELGWQSHCFDKDVPAYARLHAHPGSLVASAIRVNDRDLLPRRREEKA